MAGETMEVNSKRTELQELLKENKTVRKMACRNASGRPK